MHWIEACEKSSSGEAIRYSRLYSFIRNIDGSCLYRPVCWDSDGPEDYQKCEDTDLYVGFYDWEPFEGNCRNTTIATDRDTIATKKEDK